LAQFFKAVQFEKLAPHFCEDRNARIILITSGRCAGDLNEIKQRDAFSPKVGRPKLASAGDHASACHFWGRSNLQRDFQSSGSVRSGFLAKAGELGSRRRLRVHADEFGRLPLDSMGRVADVSGRHRLSDPDQVYGHESLWGAQLAAFGATEFSTRPTCGCRRNHGFGVVLDSISRNASDAAVTALRSDCRSAMLAYPNAT
jgi:hypothetical protein